MVKDQLREHSFKNLKNKSKPALGGWGNALGGVLGGAIGKFIPGMGGGSKGAELGSSLFQECRRFMPIQVITPEARQRRPSFSEQIGQGWKSNRKLCRI